MDFDDAVYYVGRLEVVPREDGQGLAAWQESIFALMERNSMHVSDFFRLPKDSVILIGRQIAI